MAHVTSTVGAYVGLGTANACESTWIEEYERHHREIFASYYSSWGDVSARPSAAASVSDLAPVIGAREGRARMLVEQAEVALRGRGLLDGQAVEAVLLVGVGSSNGWVTELNGLPTLFLALEVLPDPPFDEVLVAHEMTHLAHEQLRLPLWRETVGTRLFAEGLAGSISKRVVPGLSLDAYLWWDDQHAEWLDECARHSSEIVTALRADLELEESHREDQYFSARPELAQDWPARSGYWCGLVAVDHLLETHRETELLAWGSDVAIAGLRQALGGIAEIARSGELTVRGESS